MVAVLEKVLMHVLSVLKTSNGQITSNMDILEELKSLHQFVLNSPSLPTESNIKHVEGKLGVRISTLVYKIRVEIF